MIEVKLLPLAVDTGQYLFAVIAAQYRGKWVWVKHRERDTWEIPGGHIEKGETADEAASRELIEETGAIRFNIQPICDYFVSTGKKSGTSRLYLAIIDEIGPLPESEIERVEFFDKSPEKLTHSEIQPILFNEILKSISKG
ncbi:MAG: NUDIX domain-containing protein [Bacteroidales bacterium]|nr:MAG: NUDIX domain-containing protein [Bacteroidales bacterium]